MKRVVAIAPLLLAVLSTPALAQITSAPDGTNTGVNQAGNTFNITGGTQAGSNLFHSFQRFGLNVGQIANFLSSPAIANILGRVTGGEASIINGLIQVTGGTSNLFLLNPAGIVFGPNARLDVPASFTATTANGIGMGDRWLSATNPNNYAALTGTPDRFGFATASVGSIINAGNLAVGQGQSLTLLGGTIINTGTLSAPGGTITIAAVPGEKLVRLKQDSSLLSLDLPLADKIALTPDSALTPQSLPELLTGGNITAATGVSVDANGVIRLTGSNLPVNQGDVVVTTVMAQTATLSASNNLVLSESQLITTGNLNLLAQKAVQIRDTVAKPLSIQAGENLLIQGNQAVDMFVLNHPLSGLYAGKEMVLRSANPITGDAHYFVGGNLRFEQLDGNVGQLSSPNDPIILAQGDVMLGDYRGASLHILAGGSVTLGNIKITGAGDTATTINPNNPSRFNSARSFADLATITRADGTRLKYNGTPELDSTGNVQWVDPTALVIRGNERPTLDVRAGIDWSKLGGPPGNGFLPAPLPNTSPNAQSFPNASTFAPARTANITTGTITVAQGNTVGQNKGGVVLLTNQYAPKASLAGEIRVDAARDSIVTDGYQNNQVIAIDSRSRVTLGPIDVNGLPAGTNGDTASNARGISANGNSVDIRAVGSITTGDINLGSQSVTGNGSVKLVSVQGNILVSTIASGANGLDIQAGGVFQAIGSFAIAGTASTVFTSLRTNAELRNFVLSKLPQGVTLTDAQLDQQILIQTQNLQASILARPDSTKPPGTLNAPIKIQQGSGSRTQINTFDVYSGSSNPSAVPRTVGVVTIQGDSGFNGGPSITKQVDVPDLYLFGDGRVIPALNSPDQIPSGFTFNQVYKNLVFDSPNFPTATGGTIGAILVGGGSNGELYGSVLSRVFPAVILPPKITDPPKMTDLPINAKSGFRDSSPSILSPLDLVKQRIQGEDGQTVQRQLISSERPLTCQHTTIASRSIAQATTRDRGTTATASASSPCSTATDDAAILKILDEPTSR